MAIQSQWVPINPGNVLVLPDLRQPSGPLRPYPDALTAQEHDDPSYQGCGTCDCMARESETGWWHTLFTTNGCRPGDALVCTRGARQECADAELLCGLNSQGLTVDSSCFGALNDCLVPIDFFEQYCPTPNWASPTAEGFPPGCSFDEFGMYCGDDAFDVSLQPKCEPGSILDSVEFGYPRCIPIGGTSCQLPPPCRGGTAIGADGCCHPFSDPPLPLASDGNGFASPTGPFALPVHPVVPQSRVLAVCGSCADTQREEFEL